MHEWEQLRWQASVWQMQQHEHQASTKRLGPPAAFAGAERAAVSAWKQPGQRAAAPTLDELRAAAKQLGEVVDATGASGAAPVARKVDLWPVPQCTLQTVCLSLLRHAVNVIPPALSAIRLPCRQSACPCPP